MNNSATLIVCQQV